jgi:hypothetical protein
LESVCQRCEAGKTHEPGAWFNHIWFLYGLQRGGYPFRRNDLTIGEWMDLGILRETLENMKDAAKAGVEIT